jgi:hypothetical protein
MTLYHAQITNPRTGATLRTLAQAEEVTAPTYRVQHPQDPRCWLDIPSSAVTLLGCLDLAPPAPAQLDAGKLDLNYTTGDLGFHPPVTQAVMTIETALQAATLKAIAAYPDERARIERGLACIHTGKAHAGSPLVESTTRPGTYHCVEHGFCSCQDAERAALGGRCKHRWAKALLCWASKHSV